MKWGGWILNDTCVMNMLLGCLRLLLHRFSKLNADANALMLQTCAIALQLLYIGRIYFLCDFCKHLYNMPTSERVSTHLGGCAIDMDERRCSMRIVPGSRRFGPTISQSMVLWRSAHERRMRSETSAMSAVDGMEAAGVTIAVTVVLEWLRLGPLLFLFVFCVGNKV